jgi:predicted O-methyltransferase YrrM
MRPGGLMLFDNVLWKGRVLKPELPEEDKNTTFFRNFNRMLSSHPGLDTVFLPYRDGIAACHVKG